MHLHGQEHTIMGGQEANIVSRSIMEFEFRAIADVVAKLRWVGHLFRELGFPLITCLVIKCDNKSTICYSANPVGHNRTRHIDIDFHFVELIDRKVLEIKYVPTEFHITDIFIKSLLVHRFLTLKKCNQNHLCYRKLILWGSMRIKLLISFMFVS